MSTTRKVVVPAGIACLGELRELFPIAAEELADGRVFVGRTRATSFELALLPGAVVRVEARAVVSETAPRVLYEDRDLLVAEKPADWVTIAERTGRGRALLDVLACERRIDAEALHATSRLDLGVSGVVTFTKTATAREKLASLRESGAYGRAYLAFAHGNAPDHGVWDAPIGRASDPRHRRVGGDDPKPAMSRFFRIACTADRRYSLMALFPETGRTHQLRVHAAHAGLPLVGDRVYGEGRPLVAPDGGVVTFARIALHCHRVALGPPVGLAFTSDPPAPLASLWTRIGGATRDLEAFADAATKILPAP